MDDHMSKQTLTHTHVLTTSRTKGSKTWHLWSSGHLRICLAYTSDTPSIVKWYPLIAALLYLKPTIVSCWHTTHTHTHVSAGRCRIGTLQFLRTRTPGWRASYVTNTLLLLWWLTLWRLAFKAFVWSRCSKTGHSMIMFFPSKM